MGYPSSQGLYDPANEHDACGVGMVAHITGTKSHGIVAQALDILDRLDHRGAVGADPLLGDGAGILIQIPDAMLCRSQATMRWRCVSCRPRVPRAPLWLNGLKP
jgi:glutamate synthase (NADPH) large chain